MHDIIIMGAGLAGCCLGALLSKSKMKTLILEECTELGGRAKFNYFYGVPLDYGIHAILLGKKSSISAILNEHDRKINIIDIGMSIYRDGKFREFIGPSLKSTLRSELFNIREFLRVLRKSVFKRDRKALFEESLETWIKRAKIKGNIVDFLKCVSIGLLVQKDFNKVPIGQILSYLNLTLKTRGLVGYPEGGWMGIWKELNKILEESSHCELRLGEKINKINIDDGNLTLIETNKNIYEAKHYVCAFPPNLLLERGIIAENQIPETIKNSMKECKMVYGLNIDFLLSKKISDNKNLMFTINPPTLSSFPSNATPELSEEFAQVFTCFHPIGTQKPDEKELKELFDWLENYYNDIFPELKRSTVHSRKLLVPVIGAENSIEYNPLNRLSVNPPEFKNLFFIGDCIKVPGAGGETAMRSAFKLWKILKKF